MKLMEIQIAPHPELFLLFEFYLWFFRYIWTEGAVKQELLKEKGDI